MVDIHVNKGQGIFRSIVNELKMSNEEVKAVSDQQLQSIMTVIKDAQAQRDKTPEDDNIFTGGNDTSIAALKDKSKWKTDFVVKEGSFSLSDEDWGKIKGFLGKAEPPKVEEPPKEEPKPQEEAPKPEAKPQEKPVTPQQKDAKVMRRNIENVGGDGSKETVAKVKENGVKKYYQVETDPSTHEEVLGQRLVADSHGIFKKKTFFAVGDSIPDGAKADRKNVDGQKDQVTVTFKDENGKKHTYSTTQNENGQMVLGELLTHIAGTSRYVSQSQINNYVKQVFHVDKLPEGIEVQMMNSNGYDVYIYKKDGKSIDVRDVAKLVREQQAQAQTPPQPKSGEAVQVQTP